MSFKKRLLKLILVGCCVAVHLPILYAETAVMPNTDHVMPMPLPLKLDQSNNDIMSTHDKIKTNREQIFSNSIDMVLGNPKGTRQFAVFVDPYCSHCREFQKVIDKAVLDMSDLRVVIKDFPIFGDASIDAVKILKAAQQQGKYKEMQALIHKQDDAQSMAQLLLLAEQVEALDVKQLAAAVTQSDIAKAITDTAVLATKLGIDATPATVINFELILGEITLDDLKNMLKAQN